MNLELQDIDLVRAELEVTRRERDALRAQSTHLQAIVTALTPTEEAE